MSAFHIAASFGRPAALATMLSLLLSCGGSSSSSTITSVVVIPTLSSVQVNGQQTFTANALNQDGNSVGSVTFAWRSSAPGVATINSSGVATGMSSGTTQITATATGQNVTSLPAKLAVLPQIGSVSISPVSATIKVGEHQQFVASAKDAQSNSIDGVAFNWSISFSGVASIDNTGNATAISAGTAFVTASAGGVSSPIATLNVTN